MQAALCIEQSLSYVLPSDAQIGDKSSLSHVEWQAAVAFLVRSNLHMAPSYSTSSQGSENDKRNNRIRFCETSHSLFSTTKYNIKTFTVTNGTFSSCTYGVTCTYNATTSLTEDNTKLHSKVPFILHCNTAVLPIYQLFIYHSPTQHTSGKMNAVLQQFSSWCRNRNLNNLTHHNTDAVEYERSLSESCITSAKYLGLG